MNDCCSDVVPCRGESIASAIVNGVDASVKYHEQAEADSASVVKFVGDSVTPRIRKSFAKSMFSDRSKIGLHAITLRRIEASDSLEELTVMLHRAFSRQRGMGLNCTCVDQSVDVTRERIEKGDCYMAACGGSLVGTVTLYAPDCQSQSHWYHQPDVASVHQLAVTPDFQYSGLGTALLHFAEDWATERGYAELALDTAQPARHLLAYYMRHGFRFVESVRFQGKVYHSVILSKELHGSAYQLPLPEVLSPIDRPRRRSFVRVSPSIVRRSGGEPSKPGQ